MPGAGIRAIGRWEFLAHAGRGVLGVAVLGLTACNASRDARDSGPQTWRLAGRLSWSQIDLAYASAYVSAYVFVRGPRRPWSIPASAAASTGGDLSRRPGTVFTSSARLQELGPQWNSGQAFPSHPCPRPSGGKTRPLVRLRPESVESASRLQPTLSRSEPCGWRPGAG